jgi:hypothetical protein
MSEQALAIIEFCGFNVEIVAALYGAMMSLGDALSPAQLETLDELDDWLVSTWQSSLDAERLSIEEVTDWSDKLDN